MFNSAGIISKPPTKKYIDNWDEIFRKPARKGEVVKLKVKKWFTCKCGSNHRVTTPATVNCRCGKKSKVSK